MKKTLMTFGALLAVIFVVLSVLDNTDYALEKKLWRVHKQFNQAAADPQAVPSRKFDSIVSQYQKLVDKYPHSRLTARIHMQAGMTYLLKKDDAKAMETFQDILRLYPKDKVIGSVALLNIGNIYERQEEGNKALEIYNKIIDDYLLTTVGLNMPLYIANYHLRNNEKEKGERAIDRAISIYKKVAEEYDQEAFGFDASRFLVTCYYAKEDWREAVNTLGGILLEYAKSKFMNPQRALLLVKSINTVSITKVKDYDLPRKIYLQFISENPNHPFNKVLEGMLDSFNQLEEKGVTISTSKP